MSLRLHFTEPEFAPISVAESAGKEQKYFLHKKYYWQKKLSTKNKHDFKLIYYKCRPEMYMSKILTFATLQL